MTTVVQAPVDAAPAPKMLKITEAAARLGLSETTTRRLLRNEPGVNLFYTPGSTKPSIRIDESVIERVLRRTRNRAA